MNDDNTLSNDIPVNKLARSIGIIKFLHERVISSGMNYPHAYAHAAAIVDGTRIINWGQNSKKTTPALQKFSEFPTAHAEFSACRHIRDYSKLSGKDLYVIRVRSNGKLALSKPCKMCEQFLRSMGIKRLFYSTNRGDICMEVLQS